MNKSIARQSNESILLPLGLSQNSFILLIAALSKISTADKKLSFVTVKFSELHDIWPGDKNKLRYNYVSELVKELMHSDTIETDDGAVKSYFHFFDRIDISKAKSDIVFTFSVKATPHLIGLVHYTQTSLSTVCDLNSIHASRLYQLLKMRLGAKAKSCTFEISIPKLRSFLEIKKGSYMAYYDLKKYIIDKVRADLKNSVFSDIEFTYTTIVLPGSEKKVGSLVFTVTAKCANYLPPAANDKEDKQKECDRYYSELTLIVNDLRKMITKEQISKIKNHFPVAKNMSDDEIVNGRSFSIFSTILLPPDLAHFSSLDEWLEFNKN